MAPPEALHYAVKKEHIQGWLVQVLLNGMIPISFAGNYYANNVQLGQLSLLTTQCTILCEGF